MRETGRNPGVGLMTCVALRRGGYMGGGFAGGGGAVVAA